MKAMEDKIKAVLAECERLPFDENGRYFISKDIFIRKMSNGDGYLLHMLGTDYGLDREFPTEAIFLIAHSLLSLGVQSQSLDEIIKWGQDAATFGVTPEIYYELLTKIGNVSLVHSPAPDENGLLEENRRMIQAFREIWQRGLITLAELREIISTPMQDVPAPAKDPQPLVDALQIIQVGCVNWTPINASEVAEDALSAWKGGKG